MKNRNFLRLSILLVLAVILIIGGNAKAIDQLTIYLPVVIDGTAESPSPTTPPPSTTEPPPSTTEPPPSTTEPPPPTTEPPPPTTEPPPPGDTGIVVITTIFYDGIIPSTEGDEYVEIRNDDTKSIQLHNWTLNDEGANDTFSFPNFIMEPGKVCRIYTNQIHPQWCSFSFGSGSAIWNNGGDTAYLKDGNGTLIDEFTY